MRICCRTLLPFALLAAGPAFTQTALSQAARNLPAGNPLGATTIILPSGATPGAVPAPPIDDSQRQQQEAAVRARLLADYRARQAALAAASAPLPPANGASGYVDLGRIGDEQQRRQNADPGRPARGPLPSPFTTGVPGILGGGIRTAWDRR